jgi:hypothetical protein
MMRSGLPARLRWIRAYVACGRIDPFLNSV